MCACVYTHTQPPTCFNLPNSATEQGSCFSNLHTHPGNLTPRPTHSSTKSFSSTSAGGRAALCSAHPCTSGLCPRRVCEAPPALTVDSSPFTPPCAALTPGHSPAVTPRWTSRQKSRRTGTRGKWTTQALLSGPLDSGAPLPRAASTSNCDVGNGGRASRTAEGQQLLHPQEAEDPGAAQGCRGHAGWAAGWMVTGTKRAEVRCQSEWRVQRTQGLGVWAGSRPSSRSAGSAELGPLRARSRGAEGSCQGGWGLGKGGAVQTEELDRPTTSSEVSAHLQGGGRVAQRGSGVQGVFWEEASQSAGIAHGPPGEHSLEGPQTSLQSDHSSHRCGQGLKTPKLHEPSGILRPRPQPPYLQSRDWD